MKNNNKKNKYKNLCDAIDFCCMLMVFLKLFVLVRSQHAAIWNKQQSTNELFG